MAKMYKVSRKNVYLGWSIWATRTSLFVDQSSPNFFRPTWKWQWLIKFFSDVRYVDPFRRYSRSVSKVVRNHAKIWTFFGDPQFFFWGGASKNCTRVITFDSRHVVWKSFVSILPPAPKLLRLTRWIFKPNFKFSPLKFFGRPPSQLGCVLGSLGQSVARLKISGRSTP